MGCLREIIASPEVVENKPYTDKADIWALGCLGYEMISLHPPFSGNNPLQLAKKVRISSKFYFIRARLVC